jgi:hypothetical protein
LPTLDGILQQSKATGCTSGRGAGGVENVHVNTWDADVTKRVENSKGNCGCIAIKEGAKRAAVARLQSRDRPLSSTPAAHQEKK